MTNDRAERLERLIVRGDYKDWRAVVECGRDLVAEVRRLRAIVPTCERGPKACDLEIETLKDQVSSSLDRITSLEMAIFDAMASLPPGPALDALSEVVKNVDLQTLIVRWEKLRGQPGGTATVTAGRDALACWYVDPYFGNNRHDGREPDRPIASLDAFWERASGQIGPENSLLEIRFKR